MAALPAPRPPRDPPAWRMVTTWGVLVMDVGTNVILRVHPGTDEATYRMVYRAGYCLTDFRSDPGNPEPSCCKRRTYKTRWTYRLEVVRADRRSVHLTSHPISVATSDMSGGCRRSEWTPLYCMVAITSESFHERHHITPCIHSSRTRLYERGTVTALSTCLQLHGCLPWNSPMHSHYPWLQ